MEPNQSGVRTWQWVVTVIVIIALIVIGVMVFGGKGTPSSEIPVNTANSTSTPGAINRVSMTDQYPGNVVYLQTVQVENPSWVVIQTDNNGVPGAIIGSSHFPAGINPGKVNLTKPMVDGATYYAIIYTDDGSTTFNVAKNRPLTDSNGNVIMHVFHASAAVGAGLKG